MMKKMASALCACFSLFSAYAQVDLYDQATVQVIEITFSQSNWDYQMDTAKAGSEGYILADQVVVNGVVYPNCGVKYKGNSSYSANNAKNPLHIELDYTLNQSYQGYTDIKLSNGFSDPSMVREVLAYDILKNYMHCPKANYAQVYINGAMYGVFSNAESINKSFCSDHFYSSSNAFFKCNPVGGAGPGSNAYPDLAYYGTTQSSYTSRYEMKSDLGWDDLIHLCDTIKNYTGSVEEILDVDRVLWMLAFNDVFINLDSYTGGFRQNYYLYRDNNGRFNPVVWDLNMCFGAFSMLGSSTGGGGGLSTTQMEQMTLYPHQTDTGWPLIYYLFQNATYKKMYLAHVRALVEEMIDSGYLAQRAQFLHDVVADAVAADDNYMYTVANFNANLNTAVTGGGGPGGGGSPGVISIAANRATYLNSNADFNLGGPSIEVPGSSPSIPDFGSECYITSAVSNATEVYLGYRDHVELNFEKVAMYDDGAHGDGAANDGVYGALIPVNSAMIQYYIYAQNASAGMFSPPRAEYEFYTLMSSVNAINVGEVVINEYEASNASGAMDADGQFDDWVEMYNTTSTDVNLFGTYLSDDAANPLKWPFPANAVVPANGYLTIWADENGGQVGIHSNFKLSALGEEIYFTRADGTSLDSDVFGTQSSDLSVARCPNGTGVFTENVHPTFNTENTCLVNVDERTADVFEIYPNPSVDFVKIQSNTAIKEVKIFSTTGALMHVYQNVTDTSLNIDVRAWSAGLYVIQVGEKTVRMIRQ